MSRGLGDSVREALNSMANPFEPKPGWMGRATWWWGPGRPPNTFGSGRLYITPGASLQASGKHTRPGPDASLEVPLAQLCDPTQQPFSTTTVGAGVLSPVKWRGEGIFADNYALPDYVAREPNEGWWLTEGRDSNTGERVWMTNLSGLSGLGATPTGTSSRVVETTALATQVFSTAHRAWTREGGWDVPAGSRFYLDSAGAPVGMVAVRVLSAPGIALNRRVWIPTYGLRWVVASRSSHARGWSGLSGLVDTFNPGTLGGALKLGAVVLAAWYGYKWLTSAGRKTRSANRRRTRKGRRSNGGLTSQKRRAVTACRMRGHSMKAFKTLTPGNAVSTCRKCGLEVQVLAKPAANEIDIGGEALALGCGGRK